MSDERSERLRQTRNRAKQKAKPSETEEQSETEETSEPSKPSETGKTEETNQPSETAESVGNDETSEPDESQEDDEYPDGEKDDGEEQDDPSVKDERSGTYMYLPEDQKQELGLTFKVLSAEYEREFGDDLEKNRHFYPLIIQHGLEGLDSLDAQEVRDCLESMGLVEEHE